MWHEAVLAGQHFHEAAEFLDGNDAALVGLADFDLLGHAGDDLLGAGEALAVVRVDVHGAVVLDVDLGAGLGNDALDGLAARPDEQADLVPG